MEEQEGKYLKEKLFNIKRNGWDRIKEEEKEAIYKYANEYIYYINKSKTEKEIAENSKEILIKNGFCDLAEKEELHPGDKVFFVNKRRSLFAAVIGEENVDSGLNVIAAHSDSPRIDLKQNPLYEDDDLALFKTHYYGGIKKYQWTNIPLSMHGLVVKPDGERININIGENEEDTVFTISDLLPHLAGEQLERKLKDGIQGEELNVLVGSIPYSDETVTERVKLNILKLLNEKYGLTEIDFTSSEIEFVPAMKARSLGLDASMVGGYGQDDKACCYAALRGILNVFIPRRTAICVLIDKEEVGFNGTTGMNSRLFDTFVSELLNKTGNNYPNALERTFSKSIVISADVDAAYNPNFPQTYEKNNVAKLNKGVTIVKYGGVRGKSGASEAPCELVANLRNIYDKAGVKYQSSELGKVDKGGGGTISLCFANRGMDVIDSGIPVMGMHSPFEITSKYDLYQAYKGYEAFYKF